MFYYDYVEVSVKYIPVAKTDSAVEMVIVKSIQFLPLLPNFDIKNQASIENAPQ